jgi:PKD repeat protein
LFFYHPHPLLTPGFGSLVAERNPCRHRGKGPHSVSYSTAGLKSARLIVANAFGADTVLQSIEVNPTPLADFTFQTTDLEVSFQNASLFAQSYEWSFGDGAQSNEANPIHVYTTPGPYTVLLKATNACSTHEKSIAVVLTSNTNEILEASNIRVFQIRRADIFGYFRGRRGYLPRKTKFGGCSRKNNANTGKPGQGAVLPV